MGFVPCVTAHSVLPLVTLLPDRWGMKQHVLWSKGHCKWFVSCIHTCMDKICSARTLLLCNISWIGGHDAVMDYQHSWCKPQEFAVEVNKILLHVIWWTAQALMLQLLEFSAVSTGCALSRGSCLHYESNNQGIYQVKDMHFYIYILFLVAILQHIIIYH